MVESAPRGCSPPGVPLFRQRRQLLQVQGDPSLFAPLDTMPPDFPQLCACQAGAALVVGVLVQHVGDKRLVVGGQDDPAAVPLERVL